MAFKSAVGTASMHTPCIYVFKLIIRGEIIPKISRLYNVIVLVFSHYFLLYDSLVIIKLNKKWVYKYKLQKVFLTFRYDAIKHGISNEASVCNITLQKTITSSNGQNPSKAIIKVSFICIETSKNKL